MRSSNYHIHDGHIDAWCSVCGMHFTLPCSEEQEKRLETECIQDVFPESSDDFRNCMIGEGICCFCENIDTTPVTPEFEKSVTEGINEILKMSDMSYRVSDVEQARQLVVDMWTGAEPEDVDYMDVMGVVYLIRKYVNARYDALFEGDCGLDLKIEKPVF